MEHRSIKSETGIIAGVGVGYDSNIADRAGFKFEEVQNTIEKRRRERGLVVRERKKPGRKPLGPVAMSGAERKRKHDRIKRLQALVTPERRQAGVDQPLPLRRSAPVNLSRKDRKV
jgi:hypothetical protein